MTARGRRLAAGLTLVALLVWVLWGALQFGGPVLITSGITLGLVYLFAKLTAPLTLPATCPARSTDLFEPRERLRCVLDADHDGAHIDHSGVAWLPSVQGVPSHG